MALFPEERKFNKSRRFEIAGNMSEKIITAFSSFLN
jgi:hypothetical protein